MQESCIDEAGPIEAQSVSLVDHMDGVGDVLRAEEGTHVGEELQQLLKTIPVKHNIQGTTSTVGPSFMTWQEKKLALSNMLWN